MYSIFEFKENSQNIRNKSKTENIRTAASDSKSLRHLVAKLWGMVPDSLKNFLKSQIIEARYLSMQTFVKHVSAK